MLNAILIDRASANGKYGDILDACEILGAGDYGSATNAASCMIRRSPLYQEALEKLKSNGEKPAE